MWHESHALQGHALVQPPKKSLGSENSLVRPILILEFLEWEDGARGRFFVHEQTEVQAEVGGLAFSCGCDAHAELRFLVLLAGRQAGRVSQPVAPAMCEF